MRAIKVEFMVPIASNEIGAVTRVEAALHDARLLIEERAETKIDASMRIVTARNGK